MYTFDSHQNFLATTVVIAPPPSSTVNDVQTLTVTAASGNGFPATPFNCVVYGAGIFPTNLNTEVIRVTQIVGDIFTIYRGQENSSFRSIGTGDIIALTATAKTFTDIESAINTTEATVEALASVNSGANTATVFPTATFQNPVILESTLALSGAVSFNSDNVRYKPGKGLQYYNPDTGLWHTKLCTGNPPQDAWDAGQS